MSERLERELSEFLAATRSLLDRRDATDRDWEEYGAMRKQLFDRWQANPEAFQENPDGTADLFQLITLAQEQDALLLKKIRRHQSEIRRQLAKVTESKRVIDAYGRSAVFSSILPRSSI